jgi:hypothetical protein
MLRAVIKGVSHMQRLFAKAMLWCNATDPPYFQAYYDVVKDYHFMDQLSINTISMSCCHTQAAGHLTREAPRHPGYAVR